MGQTLLRLLLAIEYLLALVAVYTLWSQVGGQYHLDLMAWYWKLTLGPALAWVVVRATQAALDAERAWNTRTVAWLITALALIALMATVTYYYHLYEPTEDDELDTRSSLSDGLQPGGSLVDRPTGEFAG
jgi:hypothetical protein